MFDAIAGQLRLPEPPAERGIDRRWRRRAIRSLQLTGRERVLDLCTGTGDLAIAALDARPPARARGRRRFRRRDAAGRPREDCARAASTTRVALVRGDATRDSGRRRGRSTR